MLHFKRDILYFPVCQIKSIPSSVSFGNFVIAGQLNDTGIEKRKSLRRIYIVIVFNVEDDVAELFN